MKSVVTRSVLVAVATALVGVACRDSVSSRPVADLSAGGVRITGVGQIGSSSVTYGSSYDTFNFDVRSDLTGRMSYTETGVRSDGTVVTLVVNSLDPATHFTSFAVPSVNYLHSGFLTTGDIAKSTY